MAAGMGQGSGSAMLVLVGAVAAVLLLGCPGATADNFVVGGLSQNWALPTSNSNFYTSWPTAYAFNVNDTLQFFYDATHNVLPMPQNSCDSSLATVPAFTGGNTTITLNTTGTKYYICSTPHHCDQGMKLIITVGGAASTPLSSPATGPAGTSAAAPRLVGVIGTIAAAAFSAAAFFM
ncbi:unnamed protein product [Calypogeia fissa]